MRAEESLQRCSSPLLKPSRSPLSLLVRKSPIRRLNFDQDSEQRWNNVKLKINRVPGKDIKPFSEVLALPHEEFKGASSFVPLKKSPLLSFNTFSSNEPCVSLILDHPRADKKADMRLCNCSCKKSRCLKLYCECFSSKLSCVGCSCANCMNREEFAEERDKAVAATLEKNPGAFEPKIALTQAAVCTQASRFA